MCLCECMFVCVYVCVGVCMPICECVCAHMDVCVHTWMYVQECRRMLRKDGVLSVGGLISFNPEKET